jgi:hypothetical protein
LFEFSSLEDLYNLRSVSRQLSLYLPTIHQSVCSPDDYHEYAQLVDTPRLHVDTCQVLSGYSLERIRVVCHWTDQGWGNAKGRMSIRIGNSICVSTPHCAPRPMGRLNWELNRMDLVHAKANDRIEVWTEIGGGGGHALMITDMHVTCWQICYYQ